MEKMNGLIIEPMAKEFILWRCLHGGPLNTRNIENPQLHPDIEWPRMRARNVPLLQMLVRTYGTCAITARGGALS